MSLNSAHAGYAYQDLLSVFYILKELLEENDSVISIDQKQIDDDRFDDLVIRNSRGVSRKQIKYSDSDEGHILTKDDLANDSGYNLALHSLYNSWYRYPEGDRGEVQLCLGWKKPFAGDEINNILTIIEYSSFSNFNTTAYRIDLESLWRSNGTPVSSWRKFKQESIKIDRLEFLEFIHNLIIEVEFPKASLNIYTPGDLELITIEQVSKLGVGEYPNEHLNAEGVILNLVQIVNEARSRGKLIHTNKILHALRIRTDFGKIEQNFPVDKTKLINTNLAIKEVKKILKKCSKLAITGEPGSGKSWFIENLQKSFNKNYFFIKHYCYTDIKDDLQVDRIKVNTFYGNLISEILDCFPELKKKKHKIWASNLGELNLLLSHIQKDLIVIVDGLDHIQRVYELKKSMVKFSEADILSAISNISLNNEKVKFIVLSQPISQLDKFENFERIYLPRWSEEETEAYLNVRKIKNIDIQTDVSLCAVLTKKSEGNPLYLSYLIEELKKAKDFSIEAINKLPSYSFNLSNYYEYLLTKLRAGDILPKTFAGVNFSLSKSELVEITGMGKYIEEDLHTLLPILKHNQSTGGYSIYHESFRRYIIELLNLVNVNLWHAVFKPVAEWLEQKGFYKFKKSAKFYLPLLYENNKLKEVTEYISEDFIHKSVSNGHPWSLIKSNFKYLALSLTSSLDLNALIIVIEQNRVLASVDNDYKELYACYFEALGCVLGFDVAIDSLTFDGEPAIEDVNLGLTACRICEYNGLAAPWEVYRKEKNKGNGIQLEEFANYLVFLLCNKDYDNLEHIAGQLKRADKYKDIFQDELNNWIRYVDDTTWLRYTPITKRIIRPTPKKTTHQQVSTIRDSILNLDYISDEGYCIIEDFFRRIDYLVKTNEDDFIVNLVKPFRLKNWFYNWLIYYAKLKILIKKKTGLDYVKLKEVFNFLVIDTECFKGKIRTCDLYSVQNLIHRSFKEGLEYVNDDTVRIEILNILQKVSKDTTTTLQNSPGGPLTPSAFLEILSLYDSKEQIKETIDRYQKELESEKQVRFYQSVSEYYFRLAVLHSKVDQSYAKEAFNEAITYLLSCTYRRDMTLSELISSVESIHKISHETAKYYITKIKILADTVVNHTDGKETKWLPIHWFEKFNSIAPREAVAFLVSELLEVRYDWRLEDNLKHLLIKLNGSINPLTELLILRTFPTGGNKDFLKNSFDLSLKVNAFDSVLGSNTIKLFFSKLYLDRNEKYSDEFLTDVNSLATLFNVTTKKGIQNSQDDYSSNRSKIRTKTLVENYFRFRVTEFSNMTNYELIQYLEDSHIAEKESMGLFIRLTSITWGEEKKEVISILAKKGRSTSEESYDWLDQLFIDDSSESIYFYVSKFVYHYDGWFEPLVNISAFKIAYSLNPNHALVFLFEILARQLSTPSYNHKLSANLINTLIEVGYSNKEILNAWEALYYIIDKRIPAKEEYDWNNNILKELRGFSNEELLIILLLVRLKSFSSERTHWVICGMSNLIKNRPESLINPLRWFFKNISNFLEIQQLSILQMLYDFHFLDSSYSLNFKDELLGNYPTNYFLLDWIIEQLFNLPPRKKLLDSPIICRPTKQFVDFFQNINLRHFFLKEEGFDLEKVFGYYENTYKREYKDVHDLYFSRANESFVDNLYSPNYMLKLINTMLYNDFRDFELFYATDVYDLLKLQTNEIIYQYASTVSRPFDLKKPSELKEGHYSSSEVPIQNEWVRLGLVEYEYFRKEFREKYEIRKRFAGIVFPKASRQDFPFSLYRLTLDRYNLNESSWVEFDGCTTLILYQNDMFETLKLLWLHPKLFFHFQLQMSNLNDGLFATNPEGEIVLRYNHWRENYMGSDFDDEVPMLNGAELLLRKDYFDQMTTLFQPENPKYVEFVN